MRTPELNKILCAKYPFLKCSDGYEWTWADDMPKGWWDAFGTMMCDEIKSELVRCNFLDEYQIVQVKEKYNQLRVYDNGIPQGCKVWNIISKYSTLSENICAECGKPDVPAMTHGWVLALCEDHAFNKEEYAECAKEQYPHRMADYRRWSCYSGDKWVEKEEYIGDTAEEIRRRWKARQDKKVNN